MATKGWPQTSQNFKTGASPVNVVCQIQGTHFCKGYSWNILGFIDRSWRGGGKKRKEKQDARRGVIFKWSTADLNPGFIFSLTRCHVKAKGPNLPYLLIAGEREEIDSHLSQWQRASSRIRTQFANSLFQSLFHEANSVCQFSFSIFVSWQPHGGRGFWD